MTSPDLVLRRPVPTLRLGRLGPAVAFPALIAGLLLTCLGYLAVAVVVMRWVLGL